MRVPQFESVIRLLEYHPEMVEFNAVIQLIEDYYDFTPTGFSNGNKYNQPGENNGSCKLFSFAKLYGLSEQQTLGCFGTYYREDVLNRPDGTDHQNIRQFLQYGWDGIRFDAEALELKK